MTTEVDESLVSLLQLAMLPGIGPRTLSVLLDEFETAQAVLSASPRDLRRVAGVGPKLVDLISGAHLHVDVDALLDQCEKQDIDIVVRDSAAYPERLREICDAPPILFMRGSVLPQDSLAVAIVGTRHPSIYGRSQTESIVRGLARAGVTIVSGLARGIDGIAHQAALDVGGRTIAVLGNGLESIYPPEHTGMAQGIAADGALISEYRPSTTPRSGLFPQRNRLISGLSLGVCVMEAADRSGALITARLAGEQGRDCFALPGPVDSRVSRGPHQLIRDGAILIRCADDILEYLGPLAGPLKIPAIDSSGDQASGPTTLRAGEVTLDEQELQVLDSIDYRSTSIDSVVAATGLPTHYVLSTISVLEMRRLIRRASGQYIVRI